MHLNYERRFFNARLAMTLIWVGAVVATTIASWPAHEYARGRSGPQLSTVAFFPQQDTSRSSSQEESESEGGLQFNPRVVIPRSFPPIKNAPFVTADKAGEIVKDHDLVLGVEVNGKARAYPINLLCGPRREIINDMLGGRPIAATW